MSPRASRSWASTRSAQARRSPLPFVVSVSSYGSSISEGATSPCFAESMYQREQLASTQRLLPWNKALVYRSAAGAADPLLDLTHPTSPILSRCTGLLPTSPNSSKCLLPILRPRSALLSQHAD